MTVSARTTTGIQRAFEAYNHQTLRRTFHRVRLFGNPPPALKARVPLVVACAHSGWWDVLLNLYLASDIIRRDYYGVMDARQLVRYPFFRKLGMVGVDRTSLAGARSFVHETTQLLFGSSCALYLAPQGEMASLRRRPIRFEPGIGHIVQRLGDCYVAPAVCHIDYWNERTPEAFIALGDVIRVQAAGSFDRRGFVRAEEQRLDALIDALLSAADARDASRFQTLLVGAAGASLLYDLARGVSARLKGQSAILEHGAVETPGWRRKA